MFDFDDIIEEAVADVVEQSQKEIEVGRPEFDPDETDGYQYMLMLIENINSFTHEYDKDKQHHFFNMLMHIMRSLCSECTGDIIFYNYTTKEYNSEITGHIYEQLLTSVRIERHHRSQSYVALVVKFSFKNDLSIYARLSKLLRMFTAIESFKNYMPESPYTERYNLYNCFLFKNIDDKWTPTQEDRINIKDIYEIFHDAKSYKMKQEVKIIYYYKDLFMNKDASNELLRPVIDEFIYLVNVRWCIKVDANYYKQRGYYSKHLIVEAYKRDSHLKHSQNSVCSV